jgi:hypothetical protein
MGDSHALSRSRKFEVENNTARLLTLRMASDLYCDVNAVRQRRRAEGRIKKEMVKNRTDPPRTRTDVRQS